MAYVITMSASAVAPAGRMPVIAISQGDASMLLTLACISVGRVRGLPVAPRLGLSRSHRKAAMAAFFLRQKNPAAYLHPCPYQGSLLRKFNCGHTPLIPIGSFPRPLTFLSPISNRPPVLLRG
jgi:hypothetical protein